MHNAASSTCDFFIHVFSSFLEAHFWDIMQYRIDSNRVMITGLKKLGVLVTGRVSDFFSFIGKPSNISLMFQLSAHWFKKDFIYATVFMIMFVWFCLPTDQFIVKFSLSCTALWNAFSGMRKFYIDSINTVFRNFCFAVNRKALETLPLFESTVIFFAHAHVMCMPSTRVSKASVFRFLHSSVFTLERQFKYKYSH